MSMYLKIICLCKEKLKLMFYAIIVIFRYGDGEI